MVFGLFSKDRALKRAVEKVLNRHVQSVDRMSAMEKLRDDGSDDSLLALCRRFSYRYDKTIEDQTEKDWVVATLLGKGEAALPAIRNYLKTGDALGYPLKILGEIAKPAQALEVIDEVLADEEPGYARNPARRIDVIEWLSELAGVDNGEVARRVAPYLIDFDENVRFKAVDAIAQRPHPDAAVPLVAALVNPEEESRRLKQRIAEVLTDNDLDLGERKAEVVAMLEDVLSGFRLHRDKLQRKTT